MSEPSKPDTIPSVDDVVLLPCPFCGCIDFVIESLPKIREKRRKRVMCKKCHACGPESWDESAWHSRKNAKEAWNVRLGRNTNIDIQAEAAKQLSLARCPCGEVPEELILREGESLKYAFAAGGCCDEWHIEFRTNYIPLESPQGKALAETAWNKAPRNSQ